MTTGRTQISAADARDAKKTRGLICPKCGCRHFLVHKTKPHDGEISRRRICRHCGYRVTTMETVVSE